VFHEKLFQRPTQTWIVHLHKRVHGPLTLAVMTSSWTWGQLREELNYSVAHRGHHVWRSVNQGAESLSYWKAVSHTPTPIIQAYPLSTQQMLLHSSSMACRFHFHCRMEFPLKRMFSIFSCFCFGIEVQADDNKVPFC